MMCNGPISWFCKKQSVIAMSSAEAEYVSMALCSMELKHIKNILQDLKFISEKPIKLLADNSSAILLAKDPPFSKATRHIGVKYHFVRKMVKQNEIEILKCPGEKNAADIFTKVQTKKQFKETRKLCGISNLNKNEDEDDIQEIINNSTQIRFQEGVDKLKSILRNSNLGLK